MLPDGKNIRFPVKSIPGLPFRYIKYIKKMPLSTAQYTGYWTAGRYPAAFHPRELLECAARIREPLHVLHNPAEKRIGVGLEGELNRLPTDNGHSQLTGYPVAATLPPLYPEWLGNRAFTETHRLRFPYVIGAMARGLTTARMVIAAARFQALAFFGAAGLGLAEIEKELKIIGDELDPRQASWGSNLIHSPNESGLEDAVVDLYLKNNVRRISASAFMSLSPGVVRYAASGLTRDSAGRIRRRNHVFAKISRPEVAEQFMSPPPASILAALKDQGKLTGEEVEIAAALPVAEDITVEADSGGHTDNRPLCSLFPVIRMLRDRLEARHGYSQTIRLGAAGSLGTPEAVAAAFALGADYVLTGSVNQSAVESGLCESGRRELAQCSISDVMMAPSADMFEMGVKVQVLKRGTMFGVRAQKLHELYSRYESLEGIPEKDRLLLERDLFRRPLQEIWNETADFFRERDYQEVAAAEKDPHRKMALVFRWYLGKSSHWAISGEPSRRFDYQIWCGPAMGAFNEWVRGSFMEEVENRTVEQIGLNLLEGAAVISRGQQLRSYGVAVPGAAFDFRPRPLVG